MLPKNLKYGSKVESAGAKSYRTNVQPQTGSQFNLGDTITINIPTRANLLLVPTESYLRFDVSPITSGADNTTVRWDACGSHGVIQRIRVWHGSNLLEDIDNYGLLAKSFFDLQVSTDQAYGKANVLVGTRSDLVLTGTGVAITTSAGVPVRQVNSGDALRKANGSAILANTEVTVATTYAINLLSLVGSLCKDNYMPLFALQSAPLRVEIQLVDALTKCMNVLGTASVTNSNFISRVEYVAQFIELGDQAMAMVQQSLQGPIQFVVPSYRNYQNAFTMSNTTAQTVQMPIPAKFSSLKSLVVTARDKGTGSATFFPFSTVKNGLASYYFRVGAQVVPTKAPDSTAEMFCEAMKAVGSLADLNHQPSIDKDSYQLAVSVANTVVAESLGGTNISSGSFYIGLDLENYCSANKDTIFAGWNSNTDDIYLVMNYDATFAGTSMRYDAFAMFDAVVVCENGTAYCRY